MRDLNALRAVPVHGESDETSSHENNTDEPDYDPAVDPEAMLLCALMDVHDPTANTSTQTASS